MKYSPHEYQRYATEYIETHPIAAVLLDMGLGKTSITLTALNDLLFNAFEIRKAIVIAPLRVARDTWPAEIEKWDHLSGLIYSVAVGTEAERTCGLSLSCWIWGSGWGGSSASTAPGFSCRISAMGRWCFPTSPFPERRNKSTA